MTYNIESIKLTLSEIAHINPLISQYFKKHLEIKASFFDEDNSLTTIFHHDNEGIATKGLSAKKNQFNKILLISSIRTSHSDSNMTPILYDITIGTNNTPPQISLYRYENETLKLLFVMAMNLIESSKNIKEYELFNGTPLKISLSLFQDTNLSAFKMSNKQNEVLFSETTLETILDPTNKLISYLNLSSNCHFFDLLKEAPRISFLFDAIAESENRADLIQQITTDSSTLNSLIKLLPSLEKNISNQSKMMIEEILTKIFGKVPLVQEKRSFLPDLEPLYHDFFGLSQFENFELSQDIENASAPQFLFYGKAKKTGPSSKIEENRLIAFSIINSPTDNLDVDFNNLLTSMKKSIGENLLIKKAFFNSMIFYSIIPSTSDFTDHLIELIENHRDILQRLRVESISFKLPSGSFTDMIEIKNILGNELVIHSFPSAQISIKPTATKIELRELQVLSKGEVWAYRIPNLFQSIAKNLRKGSLGILNSNLTEEFIELDLDHSQTVIHPTTGSIDYNVGELKPVNRPIGQNEAGVVIGLQSLDLGLGVPVKRVLIIGDLSHSSRGAIRGQECIRINAAIRYAAKEKIPIDWYAASYGVQIHRERGVEGLDAAASTIREIVENCHHKGVPINFIIHEANIGAQSYWDSMAAIVYDTSGILIMTPGGSMALTGPRSLACALYGTVQSEKIDVHTKSLYPEGLQSLSGHELVHGPNSDSMILAKDLEEAVNFLLLHHYYSYLKPNEKIVSQRRIPRTNESKNAEAVHKEIDNFLKGLKPNRKMILEYLRDEDSPPALQFWEDAKGIRKQLFQNGDLPQEASTIVQEILIGGHPTLVIFTPTGPLTPADADIIARAIYKASGRMQVLVIGSLSGFSCDPLSMKNRQLLEGALIAKSIVEHKGPILIVNLGSLVGGTFVVFNKQLHSDLKILAIEGARVQVIGGKSAAKVVFHSLICKQADQDSRVIKSAKTYPEISKNVEDTAIKKISNEKLNEVGSNYKAMRSEVIAEIENKEGILFDQFHNAQRAMKVKSIDQIVTFKDLREATILNFEQLRANYLNRSKAPNDLLNKDYKFNSFT
jgi:acetyl-CoA carboxylase carboxyltransferase component